MTPARLLQLLPPFNFDVRLIADDQDTDDIICQVLTKHKERAADYGLICGEFTNGNVLRNLFTFCQRYLIYFAESKEEQTTLAPAGIIELGRTRGVDCKHYANFTAGVLDALNHRGYDIPFCYRFAGYQGADKDHVFVVAFPGTDSEVWIDPAPIRQPGGEFIPRRYNDRFAVPVSSTDKYVSMANKLNGLYSINGVSSMQVAGIEGYDDLPGWGSIPPTTPPAPAPTPAPTTGGGGTTIFDAAKSNPEVKPFVDAATTLINKLPDGGLKNFLKDYLNNPVTALKRLYFGKPFTSGAYHLGEVFMRAILGMPEIQSRGSVPDAIVPQANDFFTSALGVRVTSEDHIEQLAKSPDAYYNWLGAYAADVPRANVERAHRILVAIDYPRNQSDSRRNTPWDLNVFLKEPYIYPLPGVEEGTLWTGTNPVTNTPIYNGYPSSVAVPGSDPTPPGGQQSAGMSGGQKLLIAALLGGALYLAFRKQPPAPKRRPVKR